MSKRSDDDWRERQEQLLGLGVTATRKSYYPALRRRLQELEQAEERLRLTQFAVDHLSDAAFWIDREGRFVYVNQAACRALGYTEEELLGMGVPDIDPEFPAERWPEHWAAMKEAGSRIVESRHRCKDGRLFPVEISINYVNFGGKELHCSFARDITARKRAQAELAGARAMLEAAIEQSPAGILIADAPDVRIRVANTTALRIRGAPHEQLTAIPLEEHVARWETLHPDGTPYDPRELPLSRAILRGETVRDEDVIIRDVGGRDHHVLVNAGPVRDTDGQIAAGVVVFLDVTEHRRLEQQLSQAQKMEAVGRLAGGVAHDLNNLLSPILGYGELLLGEIGEDGKSRTAVKEIHKAALRARDLVRQLLAFGRKQPLAVRSVDLNRIVSGFEPLLRRTIRENVQIVTELTSHPLPIDGDVGQIEQVIMNLAINGQDAMPDGGKLAIETGIAELDEGYARSHPGVTPGRYVMLSISDTGHGMDEPTRQKIFDPFFTTKEMGHGTGLGLATVYGIVKQHDGNIWLYSEPGRGSTFKCYFPAGEAVQQEPVAPVSARADSGGHETILVAEDNGMVRKLAVGVLEKKGYTVLSAADGAECLQAIADHDGAIDLLLTDVVMPDMNGRALFEQVSARYPDIRIVYMSGYTENVIVHHGVLEEDVAFIQKPFTIQTLTRKVREVLDR